MWGIIAGTGFEKNNKVEIVKELNRETPFGLASSGLKLVRVDDHEVIFIPRHGIHHELLPSEINFCANIYALKKHGATQIISVSAVGSLQRELSPGTMVVPLQYIDKTKGTRRHTFSGDGMVAHVSLARPVSPELVALIRSIQNEIKCPVSIGGTYICIEGPYFSTHAESLSYRALNASIIGMTNFPEYALAREAGIAYLPCCFVTDYDCWDENIPHVTVEEVLLQMKENNTCAYEMIPLILNKSDTSKVICHVSKQDLSRGLLTAPEALNDQQQDILKLLAS
jgi:5'-methylthioadenosine phosphorylase